VGTAKYVGTVEGKEVQTADVNVEVREEKYRMEIAFRKDSRDTSTGSKIIVREPTAVFFRTISKTGYASNHILKESVPYLPPEMTVFPFGPIRLMRMIDLGTVDENKIVAAKELENGDVELLYANPPAFARVVCAKGFGFNYSICEGRRGNISGPIASSETLEWKRIGDRWYVMQIVRMTSTWEHGKKVRESRSSFAYTSFDPSREPDDSRFSLESLDLHSGARIQDRRPGAAEKDHYYKLDSPPKPNESLDKLVERMPVSLRPRPWYSRNWFRWTMSAVGVLVLSSGLFTLYKRRKARRESDGPESGIQTSP
jgi:hypothetical protein